MGRGEYSLGSFTDVKNTCDVESYLVIKPCLF